MLRVPNQEIFGTSQAGIARSGAVRLELRRRPLLERTGRQDDDAKQARCADNQHSQGAKENAQGVIRPLLFRNPPRSGKSASQRDH